MSGAWPLYSKTPDLNLQDSQRIQMKNRFTRNASNFFQIRFINTWMTYLLILWTLSLSSDKIPYNLGNFHAFESQDPRTKKFGLDSIAYRAIQLWKNIPEEIRSSPSLLIFKESIKKVPFIFCSCHCWKTYIHHVGYI